MSSSKSVLERKCVQVHGVLFFLLNRKNVVDPSVKRHCSSLECRFCTFFLFYSGLVVWLKSNIPLLLFLGFVPSQCNLQSMSRWLWGCTHAHFKTFRSLQMLCTASSLLGITLNQTNFSIQTLFSPRVVNHMLEGLTHAQQKRTVANLHRSSFESNIIKSRMF